MKSSHFYYIILFSFLLAACKDDGQRVVLLNVERGPAA